MAGARRSIVVMAFVIIPFAVIGQASYNSAAPQVKKEMREALYKAIEMGTFEEVRSLLDRGVPVEAKDNWGYSTPFLSAAWFGRVDVLRLLAARGADIHAANASGNAVMHAEFYNQLETVECLRSLGLGKDPLYSDAQGNYLLYYAYMAWRLDSKPDIHAAFVRWAVEQLRAGARMDFTASSGESTPWLIITLDEPELLKAAKDRGLKVSERVCRDLPLYLAQYRPVELLRLLKAGADPDEYGSDGRCPREAAYWNSPLAERLMSGRVKNGEWWVSTAAGDVKVTEENVLTIDLGNDARYSPPTFEQALRTQDMDLVHTLLHAGQDPNERGSDVDGGPWWSYTPLTEAIDTGNVDLVKLLIDHGADVHLPSNVWYDCRDEGGGETALLWALRVGQERVAAYLLDRGADPDLPGVPLHKPRSCLAQAVTVKDEPLFDRILSVCTLQTDLDEALSVAVKELNRARAQKLLAKGASFTGNDCFSIDLDRKSLDFITSLGFNLSNSRTVFGIPVLIQAMPDYECTSYLLELGVDPNIPDSEGRTPLSLALEWKNAKLEALLRQYGAWRVEE